MVAVAACKVERWQERHRGGWDAIDGRNGGAVRVAWVTPLEMERFVPRRLRVSVSQLCVGLGDALQEILQERFVGAMRLLRAPTAISVCRVRGGAGPDHHGHPLGSTWRCFLLRIVLEHALNEVVKVFADDIPACLGGRSKELPVMAETVFKTMVDHGRMKGRKEQGLA